ncbi:MAG: 1-deoxy-D-xylulose-5-phosphate synthase [Clostridiales bacterium]|nr:1-deoxy-D-xylulose-5-phosphate synthase [Clostridiales bacterium]
MTEKILDKINKASDIKTLSNKEVRILADELRSEIITTVSKNGGHLASNLGVVEVTIALHRIFDTPKDKIIFDVGHQCYAHKILTSRRERFPTIRQENGLSGFPKREESEYDAFNTGHSSTSISAAVGMARVRDLSGDDRHIIALIGDGALTGGMVWEALNDAGHSGEKIIVILNDNEMSIGRNVGAVSTYLSNIRSARGYIHLKGFIAKVLGGIPLIGKHVKNFVERIKNIIKYSLMPNIMFEQLGFKYYGLVDGHDIADLEKILEHVKQIDDPVIIHVKTQKGKGADYSTNNPEQYHSTCPFDIETGIKETNGCGIPSAISSHLIELSKEDETICTITASMEQGCGLEEYKQIFPERFFDVGIAEQHAVTMCAGMAAAGYKPIFSVYSSFIQRAYDQILHDVCMQNLGVTILVYNTGVVGADGETHHGVFDISFLRHIPNLNLLAPSSVKETLEMIDTAINSRKPTIILLPKQLPNLAIVKSNEKSRWTKFTKAENPKICILANGSMLINSMDAIRSDDLYKKVDIYNARYMKPMDIETIKNIVKEYAYIVTVEDNLLQGGFGSAILEELEKIDFDTRKLIRLGYSDEYIPHGKISSLHKLAGIDKESIANRLIELLNE